MGDTANPAPAESVGDARPSAGVGGAAPPDTIHAPLTFGGKFSRFDGLSALALARRNPGLAQWCAENRGDRVGRLCAEALAQVLGVSPARTTP